jgi:hypothetical protein
LSTLIVLGNINQFTFVNSILAANNKAVDIFDEALTDIFVIHSTASQAKLSSQTDWVKYLENNGISQEIITHRIIEIDSTRESVERFVNYIEIILNGVLPKNPNLIVDLTNGTSLHKNLLSTAAYILDLGYQYLIDIVKVSTLTKERDFLPLDILKASYVPVPSVTQLDSIAYLNLAEVVRYKRLIEQHTEKYVQIDTTASDRTFFEGNLAHSIRLKLQGDQKKDNAIYRIAASSISASVEDLIGILIDKFVFKEAPDKESRRTFGQKLGLIQSNIESKRPSDFDIEFFRKFNDFILYLRNSSTHKRATLMNIEKFKAELSVKMLFPFIEFYTDIIYPILEGDNYTGSVTKLKRLSSTAIDANDIFYFGLDGDSTGSKLEDLFLSSYDEVAFKKLSNSITQAIDEMKKYIRSNFSNNAIIFATGDGMLFKGPFDETALQELRQMYQKITSGLTCSIGYGKTLKEAYLALKLAKAEPGKNCMMGIKIV